MLIDTSTRFETPIDNIEDLFGNTETTDQALLHYLRTKLAYEKLGLRHTINYGHVLFCLSVLYEMLGNNDLAGDYARAAYTNYKKLGYNGIWKEKARHRAEKPRTNNIRVVNY